MNSTIRIVNLQSSSTREPLEFKKGNDFVIFCEGLDEVYFAASFVGRCLHHISHSEKKEREVVIITGGGINDLRKGVSLISKASGFKENVRSFLMMQDAERSAKIQWDRAKDTLRVSDLPVPHSLGEWTHAENTGKVNTAVILFPQCGDAQESECSDTAEPGTLESLLLSTLKDSCASDILMEVERFLNACEEIRGKPFKHKHKNRLPAYFAATDKYVYHKLGEATRDKAFDFDNPAYDTLTRLIDEALRK